MKYLVVDLFDEFQCSADVCPNTCCAGWKIIIDAETEKKMFEKEDQLGVPAKAWLAEDNGLTFAKLDDKKRCMMLNEKNLCNVVLRLGEEYLSGTCAQYPRIMVQYGAVMEAYLNLSCPEVIKGLMEKKRVEFILGEDDIPVSEYPFIKQYLFESSVRTEIINLMQKSEYSLRTRLFTAFNILNTAVDTYQQGKNDFNALKEKIDGDIQEENLRAIDRQLDIIIDETKRYTFLQQIKRLLAGQSPGKRFRELVQQVEVYFSLNDSDRYVADFISFRKEIISYDSFYSNYWIYRFFSELISLPNYNKVKEKFLYIGAEFCLFQMLAFVSYINNKSLNKDEYIYIISAGSRMLEHSKEFHDKLIEQMKENDLVNAAGLLMMTLI